LACSLPPNRQHRCSRVQPDTKKPANLNRFGNLQQLKKSPANLNRFENGQRIKYPEKPNQHVIISSPTTTTSTPAPPEPSPEQTSPHHHHRVKTTTGAGQLHHLHHHQQPCSQNRSKTSPKKDSAHKQSYRRRHLRHHPTILRRGEIKTPKNVKNTDLETPWPEQQQKGHHRGYTVEVTQTHPKTSRSTSETLPIKGVTPKKLKNKVVRRADRHSSHHDLFLFILKKRVLD
jgi:hypothetical protein